MSDVINREPLIKEMEWFIKRGVPGRSLDFIVSGFITAFEKTCPDITEYYANLFFDNLRLHPLIHEPDARGLPRSVIAENMEEILSPLKDVMKKVRGPISEEGPLSQQIMDAYADFHGRVRGAHAFTANRARVFKMIFGIDTFRPRL